MRELCEERREERRLSDPELAHDDAARHHGSVDRGVIGTMELRLLGVAADEVVLRVRLLGGFFFTREASLERIDPHRRRKVLYGRVLGLEVERRRVAPPEV